MAKRKTSGKRKASRKKKGKKGGGGVLIALIGVILVLVVIASYYYTRGPQSSAHGKQQSGTETRTENRDSKDTPPDQTSRESPAAVEESQEINPDLPDYEEVDSYYFTHAFDFPWPSYEVDDQIVEHEGFTLRYDERNEQAIWVAHKLEKKNLDRARYKRQDNYRPDPLIRTESADPSDYKNSGYDRGHLAPAGDFTWSEKALDQTFYMSNISPQLPELNQGMWRALEEQVRDWARANNIVYVVTGPIVKERKKRIGKNRVTVPQYFYKVILDIEEPELKAIAFLMKNQDVEGTLMDFAVSVDELEKMTGLDFFPDLPDEMENNLESSIDRDRW